MRRLVGWISGALGGITAYRLLRRRPEAAAEPDVEPDRRADDLRARLAESRAAEPPAAETVVEEPPAEPVADDPEQPEAESPDERRRRVHEEGRTALDDMKSD